MHDSEVVAAIVAGDPDGLAEAYDRYAAPLYTYCRSLLREPADAADAVQDTFVIAASKLAGLRDQSRLRPWLYAVARNECHRRLREKASAATSALEQVPEMSDGSADVAEGAERAELRALLRSAVRGLGASEQDLIQLQLQQELDVAEIAAMLGVTRNHAHALLSRARAQLEISLGALLVARSGRGDCEALGALLEDWDGQLNVLMRKRINRHIERCPACTERKRRELAPALLLGLAPVPIALMPPGLRTQVLRLVSSDTPDAVAHRASVAQRADVSGPGGFPKPLDPPESAWWQARAVQAARAPPAARAVRPGPPRAPRPGCRPLRRRAPRPRRAAAPRPPRRLRRGRPATVRHRAAPRRPGTARRPAAARRRRRAARPLLPRHRRRERSACRPGRSCSARCPAPASG
jgi:RNA polymerase sigma factor (sigma-70 family)